MSRTSRQSSWYCGLWLRTLPALGRARKALSMRRSASSCKRRRADSERSLFFWASLERRLIWDWSSSSLALAALRSTATSVPLASLLKCAERAKRSTSLARFATRWPLLPSPLATSLEMPSTCTRRCSCSLSSLFKLRCSRCRSSWARRRRLVSNRASLCTAVETATSLEVRPASSATVPSNCRPISSRKACTPASAESKDERSEAASAFAALAPLSADAAEASTLLKR
mmetsp:Transcript_98769/g.175855  ORF Transcript_98769/g.175855 Transcript_98769/m.175855 type:complete len:229 (-) Transcript_98769:1689-2375(-)